MCVKFSGSVCICGDGYVIACADFGGSLCQSVHSGVCKKCVTVHVRTLAAHAVSLCIVECVRSA